MKKTRDIAGPVIVIECCHCGEELEVPLGSAPGPNQVEEWEDEETEEGELDEDEGELDEEE